MVDTNLMKLNTILLMMKTEEDQDNDNAKEHIINVFNIPGELYDELVHLKTKLLNFLVPLLNKYITQNKTDEFILHECGAANLPLNIVKFLISKDVDDNSEEQKEHELLEDDFKDLEVDNAKITDNSLDEFEWRPNQINAIQQTITQGFTCGVHYQIMGAGKTYILLKLIDEYNNRIDAKNLYHIILCSRQEILRQMFSEKSKKQYLDDGVIDLDDFNIIDCVTRKPNDIFSKKPKKPTIVVVNEQFMKMRNYDELSRKNTGLILMDECHSVSATQTYKMLRKIKYEQKIPIIGFSATPLRERAENKLIDIFSKTFDDNQPKSLNIISMYDYISATKDEITLPFKIYSIEVKKTSNVLDNVIVIDKIIKRITKTLPYKKIIAWCGTIENMVKWYKFFDKHYDFNVYMSSHKDSQYRESYNCDYDAFCKEDGNSILLCVNRCREGVDIPHVDCGVYLDAVKKRSILVYMQTAGRVIRPDDKNPALRKKKRAIILDTFINDDKQKIELLTIQKIIGQYLQILNLIEEDEYNYKEQMELYQKVLTLKNNTVINEEKNQIIIKIDDEQKHNVKLQMVVQEKSIDWGYIREYLEKEIDHKFKVERNDKFKMIIQKLKDSGEFSIKCDFWKVYSEVCEYLDLPKNFRDEFKEEFKTKSWYEWLEFDTSRWYQSIKVINKAIKGNYDGELTEEMYLDLVRDNKKLPPYPHYMFKLDELSDFVDKININMGIRWE